MRRSLKDREWSLVEAALAKAAAYGFPLEVLGADFRGGMIAEFMNRSFAKFHLGNGFALHRFTGTDLGPPHDHPADFTTLILSPYVEEIYSLVDRGWTSRRVSRRAGSTHVVAASTIHQIVELPDGVSWTLAKFEPHVRTSRMYRFGEAIETREWRQRRWRSLP